MPWVFNPFTGNIDFSEDAESLLNKPNLFSRAQTIQPSQAETALTIRRGTAGQTQDIMMVQAQDNTILAKFDKDGKLQAPSATFATDTITADNPAVSATQTWNAAGVTFTGYKLNITDTASNAGSLLMDLQVGSSSKFKVAKDGSITTESDVILKSPGGTYYKLEVTDAGVLQVSTI